MRRRANKSPTPLTSLSSSAPTRIPPTGMVQDLIAKCQEYRSWKVSASASKRKSTRRVSDCVGPPHIRTSPTVELLSSEPEEIKLNMTSMIDIVFQLLVFFVLTFRVTAMEGDFKIKMPLASVEQDDVIEELPDFINIRLVAGENGVINSIVVNDDQVFDDDQMYIELTNLVEQQLAGESDPEDTSETEVEFDIDYGLKYTFTVKAIEAVSGRVQPDGTIKKLVEKIKFKDNTR